MTRELWLPGSRAESRHLAFLSSGGAEVSSLFTKSASFVEVSKCVWPRTMDTVKH